VGLLRLQHDNTMPLDVGQQSPPVCGQAGYSAQDDVPILSVAVGRNVPLGDKVGLDLGTVGTMTGVAVTGLNVGLDLGTVGTMTGVAVTGLVFAMIVTDAVTVLNKVADAE
jgi:hypothetical protein